LRRFDRLGLGDIFLETWADYEASGMISPYHLQNKYVIYKNALYYVDAVDEVYICLVKEVIDKDGVALPDFKDCLELPWVESEKMWICGG
jgi:hypothetical protein